MNKKILIAGLIFAALIITYLLLKNPLANKYNAAGIDSFVANNYTEAGKNFKKASLSE